MTLRKPYEGRNRKDIDSLKHRISVHSTRRLDVTLTGWPVRNQIIRKQEASSTLESVWNVWTKPEDIFLEIKKSSFFWFSKFKN